MLGTHIVFPVALLELLGAVLAVLCAVLMFLITVVVLLDALFVLPLVSDSVAWYYLRNPGRCACRKLPRFGGF